MGLDDHSMLNVLQSYWFQWELGFLISIFLSYSNESSSKTKAVRQLLISVVILLLME